MSKLTLEQAVAQADLLVDRPTIDAAIAGIADAIARIRRAGKAPGILTPNEALARKYLELGCTFTAVGLDTSVLVQATSALAARFKQAAAPAPKSQTY